MALWEKKKIKNLEEHTGHNQPIILTVLSHRYL